MVSKPRPQSHLLHSGFLDLVDLVSQTTSKLAVRTSSSRYLYGGGGNGIRHSSAVAEHVAPGVMSAGGSDGNGPPAGPSGMGAPRGDELWNPIPTPAAAPQDLASGASASATRQATDKALPAENGDRRVPRIPVAPQAAIPSKRAPAPNGNRARPLGSTQRPIPAHQASRARGNGQVALRYRKVNKKDISYPTHFRHVLHASTYEEAAELLMRWSVEGLDNKMGDPAWAHPMKEIVQARAREQQALAVAQVVEATAWSKTVGRNSKQKLAPGQLHVVNGLPSSIYSTINNTLTPRSAPPPLSSSLDRVLEAEAVTGTAERAGAGASSGYFSPKNGPATAQGRQMEEPSIAELLADAETPMLIANMPSGSISGPESSLGGHGFGAAGAPGVPAVREGRKEVMHARLPSKAPGGKYPTNPFMPTTMSRGDMKSVSAAGSQVLASNVTPGLAAESAPDPDPSNIVRPNVSPPIRASPPKQPLGPRAPLKRRISPIQIKKKALSPPPAESAEQAYMIKATQDQRVDEEPKSPSSPTFPPFRVIEPSLPTLERAMSIALYFEQYYHGLLKIKPVVDNQADTSGDVRKSTEQAFSGSADGSSNYLAGRAQRRADLEVELAGASEVMMSDQEKQARRRQFQGEENRILRERRRKVDVQAFEMGRVFGHGAFGVVRIAREKRSGGLRAIKQLRKADMLRKSQEGHIKAEKDVLAAAATRAFTASPTLQAGGAPSWIVKLHYAFQDIDNLYLVLDYMGGGDLLNLLVALDTFSERMTRFYMAEMILALAETHALGYIHRDIKPDNFLFTPEGHVRVSDFGLATDLHWAHDTNHYQHQREALLKRHGVDLEYPQPSGTVRKKMRKKDVERIMGKEWVEKGEGVLSWRDKNRRSLAYSICGTNSYMAPEVIRGQGYGFSCDWWSLGVIMYECLYGYPPFVSNSRHATRQKILHWKTHLKFPPSMQVSKQCVDFMTKLLCEPEDRLGSSDPPTPGQRASSILGSRIMGSGGALPKQALGLGSDGVEQIKAHPWFADIDWDTLHLQPAPYNPALAAEDDTKHFDTDIPDEPLAAPNGAPADGTRDPMLGHIKHGKQLLEIRKELAFKGWTFKSPTAGADSRYGHLERLSSDGSGEFGDMSDGGGTDGHGVQFGDDATREESELGRLGLHMPITGTVMVRGGTIRGRALSV